ncbi:MAG TPA: helix-turn-helix domain-containing protein [Coriobacteriia bacterium]|nr:helix-turn-helix domain-containing protein [Coriobacteriia bacterium]
MNLDNAEEVLTISEVAKLLRIGRNTAYRMAKRKTIPTLSLGRRLVVPKRALLIMLSDGCSFVGVQ